MTKDEIRLARTKAMCIAFNEWVAADLFKSPRPTLHDRLIRAIENSDAAMGLVTVPKEPTMGMIEAGYEAARNARAGGISGMSIEAQALAAASREIAAYRAMIVAHEEEK